MASDSNGSQGGPQRVGLGGLLGVAFVVLKLCGVIDWSWWWVTAPFWAPLVVVLVVAGAVFAVLVVIDVFQTRKRNRKARPNRGNRLQ